jgi:hypothetical protein
MGKKYWRCPVIMRALYLSAEIETDIYTWIKDCIREHGFKEGYDYYRSGSEQMGPLEYNLPQSSIVEYGLEFWAAYDIANIMEGHQKELALKFLNDLEQQGAFNGYTIIKERNDAQDPPETNV